MKNIIIHVSLLVIAVLVPAGAYAQDENAPAPVEEQESMELSLQDCIKMSMQNNVSRIITQNNLALSEENINAALAVFEPAFYAQAGYADKISPSTNPFITGADKLESSGLSSTIGIKKLFSPGTSLDAYFISDKSKSNSQWSLVNPAWDSAIGIKLSQALLKGRGREYNLSAFTMAKNSRDMAAFDTAGQMINLLYDTQIAYWNLIDAINQKKVRDKMLESARQLLEINRAKEAAHTISPVEVLQAEAYLATQEEAILIAEKSILDIEDQLKKIIFPVESGKESLKWNLRVKPTTAVDFLPVKVNINKEIAKAVENRSEYLKLKKQAENGDIDIASARNELMPELNLSAAFQLNGLEGDFSGSAGDVFSENNRTWEVGISFQIPIGNGAAKSKLSAADIAKRNILLQIKDYEQQIITEVRKAAREIETMYKRVNAAQKSLELARKQLEAEMKRLENGQSTTYNVLEFQKALTQAESNYNRAMVDYGIAKLNLARSTGTLTVASSAPSVNLGSTSSE